MFRIVLSSPKGGCGKTHLARNLAAAAAHDGYSVSTADLDPQRTLTRWARRRPQGVPGVNHYEVEWDDAEALVSPDGIDQTDILIIDTPPSIEAHPVEFKRLIAGADLILVPCRTTFDDVESAVPYLQTLRSGGARPVVVMNATKPRVNVAPEKTMLISAAELCPIEIGDRADHNRAAVRGMSLVDMVNHPGGDEIRGLWTFVRERVRLEAAPAEAEAPAANAAKKGRRNVEA
ncbi:ParA family protein [Belnapia sp. T18]|uniref:ParA family protein n=1 Tax=Belnapia arida TaxID=2804533 RepID=A0ABS1UCG1_9PROT|nr:ParA family protein [Belnapia arida]MBL6081639.1 ParA family protein [Belnapia arida]